MNVTDVVRRVRESAGDIAVLQFSNAVLTDWINDAIRECVIENNLLQARATTSTVVDQKDYSLPTDIFKLHSVVLDGYKLEVLTLEQWQERNATGPVTDLPTGSPFVCYIYAGVLTLFPTPDKIMSMQVNYVQHPPVISYNDGDGTWSTPDLQVPQQYHNRIVTYCLAQVAMQDDDYDKYQSLMTEFRTGVVDLKKAKDQEDDLYPFISVSSRDMGDAWYGDHFIP